MPLGFVQEIFTPGGGRWGRPRAEVELAQMAESLLQFTAMMASEIHDEGGDLLGWCDSQEEFEFTLDLLLEWFARQLG